MAMPRQSAHEHSHQRLIHNGPAALTETELLAILWRNSLSHTPLQQLCTLDYAEFCQQPGMGIAQYCQLHAALELSRRYWRSPLERPITIASANAVARYLLTHLRNPSQEIFAALFLDNKHRLIQFEKLFFGTIHYTTIHPRIVVKRALAHNAAAVIVAHNHPSGVIEASQADLEITEQLRKALMLVDVELLDHLIIGTNTVGAVCLTGSLVSGIKSDLFVESGVKDG